LHASPPSGFHLSPRQSESFARGVNSSYLSTTSSRSISPRFPNCGKECLNVCTGAWTDQASNVSDIQKEDTRLLQRSHDIIDQLKNELKKDITKIEARLESQLHASLRELAERAKLQEVWRTQVDNRLCVLEEHKQDLVKMIADFETRSSALEGRLAALPGLSQFRQYSSEVKQEVARTKTDMEDKVYQLGDQLGVLHETIGVLHETIHQHKVTYTESITYLKATLEDKVAVMQQGLHSIRCMHINSQLSMQTRLNTVEGSIDVTKLSHVLREVPQSKTASGSDVDLNETSASGSSITQANDSTPHTNDMTDSCCIATQDFVPQESVIMQRQADSSAQKVEDPSERQVLLDMRPVSRECYTIFE